MLLKKLISKWATSTLEKLVFKRSAIKLFTSHSHSEFNATWIFFQHCLQSKLLKFKTIWKPLWRPWIVFLIKGKEMAWWVMSPVFCRRQSRPLPVVTKVKTQHLMWIYELRRGFLWPLFLQASWGQWEHKTSDLLNKNHYQMDLLKAVQHRQRSRVEL